MKTLLRELLDIPSPTFKEGPILNFISDWLSRELPSMTKKVSENGLIGYFPIRKNLPTIALVGHVDVVPEHFKSNEIGGKIFGAGASDMKGADAAFLTFLATHGSRALEKHNLVLILYTKEEGTPVEENGLYHLFVEQPDIFEAIDLAIVGEPTDTSIQV
ncbi:MAG: acetylornithine deacetylase/succinyl-diaminopimelate desuccinylase-like protein, partial [Candidatus Marinamargulisbacteria bacterium]